MYKIFFTVLILFYATQAQDIYEAEDATLDEILTATSPTGYSGTGVANMKGSGSITFNVDITTAGIYEMILTVATPSGKKDQQLFVDGNFYSKLIFEANDAYFDYSAGAANFTVGTHTIKIEKEWGYMVFDKLTLIPAVPIDYSSVDTLLINPNSNDFTKELYARLQDNYGTKIISGQVSYWDELVKIAERTPVVRAFDFQPYTQGYTYLWDNATDGHILGWADNKITEEAIDWYNSTDKNGIVTIQWHWHPPKDAAASTNSFYTKLTTFDVSKIDDITSEEYTLIIEDIDSIATQLKKLEAADVPVLWRPLHEAGGAWFWWGAQGAETCKKLYNILYDRLTNHHKINNLIWIWSTPEADWYPGNDVVDIFGFDSYPGEYVYGSQKSMFDQIYKIVDGKKMIAMTENGPIPDIEICMADDAMWLYYAAWDDLVAAQNSTDHIKYSYEHKNVITLDDLGIPTATKMSRLQTEILLYPNPAVEVVNIILKTDQAYTIEVKNSVGVTLFHEQNVTNTIQVPVSHWKRGIYYIIINGEIFDKVYLSNK